MLVNCSPPDQTPNRAKTEKNLVDEHARMSFPQRSSAHVHKGRENPHASPFPCSRGSVQDALRAFFWIAPKCASESYCGACAEEFSRTQSRLDVRGRAIKPRQDGGNRIILHGAAGRWKAVRAISHVVPAYKGHSPPRESAAKRLGHCASATTARFGKEFALS